VIIATKEPVVSTKIVPYKVLWDCLESLFYDT